MKILARKKWTSCCTEILQSPGVDLNCDVLFYVNVKLSGMALSASGTLRLL